MVTIPEDGDLVILGFEYGDPSRPYVIGSMFSEKTSAGGGEGNKSKSITTRSGSTITLDDDKGSAELKDKHGSDSKMTLDGNKNITIDADTSITINIGKGQCVFAMSNDGKVSIDAKAEIKLCVDGTNTLTMTPSDTILDTQTKVDIKAPTVNITGTTKVDVNGGEITLN
jgi:uncharacterized protein involved in type VI secretion and phage assembly